MQHATVLSNEAEFERWLIAALQYERQRLFGAERQPQINPISVQPTSPESTSPQPIQIERRRQEMQCCR